MTESTSENATSNFKEQFNRQESVETPFGGIIKIVDIPPKELIDAAIGGMRSILDPHTVYMEKSDYDNLKISTTGKFGGLGITISIRDNILTVICPSRASWITGIPSNISRT